MAEIDNTPCENNCTKEKCVINVVIRGKKNLGDVSEFCRYKTRQIIRREKKKRNYETKN